MLEKSMLNLIEKIAYKYALLNAIKHNGKAMIGPVVAKVIGEKPELKPYARDVVVVVKKVVDEVNKLTLEEQVDELKSKWPELLEVKPTIEKKELPPLPNVDKYPRVTTRFAPNPDFVLTLGNARAAILSYEYARRYNGKFILRFEDTDPKTKTPLKEAYELIREDLKWLGLDWDEEYIQSLRMEIFYKYARKLIEVNGAYVDLCSQREFQKLRNNGIPCPHRDQPVENNLELWDRMVNGWYGEGEAVLRIKTDLKHPDPPVRDWVAFRIIDTDKNPHPLVGSRYVVWPTYNYAAAIDDHLMGVSHILRGREHAQNTTKQMFLYAHLGWKYPETIHFGRLRFEGFVLSKSKIRGLLEGKPGEYEGYDDPRFGTLRSLRKRGFIPETIRRIIFDVGVKPSDATISFDNIASINRKILDRKAPRIMFVANPVRLHIENVSELKSTIPFHPEVRNMGYREIIVKGAEGVDVYISEDDVKLFREHNIVRLMELVNVELVDIMHDHIKVKVHSYDVEEAKKVKAPIIQWVGGRYVETYMIAPKGDELERVKGLSEYSILKFKPDDIVQFVRVGFVRIHELHKDKVKVYYAHP